jgi:hypothetical protein
MGGKRQEAAAAAAGMSVRTARTWQRGPMPSASPRQRTWRTRGDPFGDVWDEVIVPLLRQDAGRKLEATTLLALLEEHYPGRYSGRQLRTLQRRLRDWRALHGPEQEVFFSQVHPPGREAQMDFTHAAKLGVTIDGQLFRHLLFEFVLSYSGWRAVGLAFGETFEALVDGLQRALWDLGGVPDVVRSDNLSAATHDLKRQRGRVLNDRFRAVLDHYGLKNTRINPRASHENGIAAHRRLKGTIEQALIIRGSRDFPTVEAYRAFIARVVDKQNQRAHVQQRLEEERAHLRPLPPAPIPACTVYRARVHQWSTVRVAGRTYTVPARLIGHEVEARVYARRVDVVHKGHVVAELERLRGDDRIRIDYRHVIGSLVRKPGAFARYRYREHLFPTPVFRRAYTALSRWRGQRGDVDYLRILHLAATTMEAVVERVLARLLDVGDPFDYTAVRDLAAPPRSPAPELAALSPPDLRVYDQLLQGVSA